MMCFKGMLVNIAKKAGMKVPSNPDDEETWDREDYPHFFVFCMLQLNRPMDWDEPSENAAIIAAVPEEKLKTMTVPDFLALGLRFKT